MWVPSLDWEDALEEKMATYSSILAWRIPWTEEPGRLQSIVLKRVIHDWNDFACNHTWPGICQCFPRISRITMGVEVVIFSDPLPESLILWIPSCHSSIPAPTLGPMSAWFWPPLFCRAPHSWGYCVSERGRALMMFRGWVVKFNYVTENETISSWMPDTIVL